MISGFTYAFRIGFADMETVMFRKIKEISPMPDYKLSVRFCEGIKKIYDVKPLFEKIPAFAALKAVSAEAMKREYGKAAGRNASER